LGTLSSKNELEITFFGDQKDSEEWFSLKVDPFLDDHAILFIKFKIVFPVFDEIDVQEKLTIFERLDQSTLLTTFKTVVFAISSHQNTQTSFFTKCHVGINIRTLAKGSVFRNTLFSKIFMMFLFFVQKIVSREGFRQGYPKMTSCNIHFVG